MWIAVPGASRRDTHAFQDAYVGDDGSVKGGTQTAYLLALGFGLLPDDLVDAAAGHTAGPPHTASSPRR